jgi:hypothetical protein
MSRVLLRNPDKIARSLKLLYFMSTERVFSIHNSYNGWELL